MGIWGLEHLAALFKWKMTFHSRIRNWKHQAQKQSMRITTRLINDLTIQSERAPREAGIIKSPFVEQRMRMSPGRGTLRLGSLREEFCRVWSHPGKPRSLFQSPASVWNSILMNSGVGRQGELQFTKVFSFSLHSWIRQSPAEQPGPGGLALPCLGCNEEI